MYIFRDPQYQYISNGAHHLDGFPKSWEDITYKSLSSFRICLLESISKVLVLHSVSHRGRRWCGFLFLPSNSSEDILPWLRTLDCINWCLLLSLWLCSNHVCVCVCVFLWKELNEGGQILARYWLQGLDWTNHIISIGSAEITSWWVFVGFSVVMCGIFLSVNLTVFHR